MKNSIRVIDAHTHVFGQWAALAIKVMDRCGIEYSVTLGWEDAFGEVLDQQLKAFTAFPKRFAPLCNIDWSMVNRNDFGTVAADALEKAVEKGCHGLKIFKSLGLSIRDEKGDILRVNDERLDPIFDRAGKINIPVLIHSADPVAFWQPLVDDNFWSGVLNEGYSHWSYYRKGLPSREELLGERDCLLSRHPNTIFVAPHLASLADDPLLLEEKLGKYPNLYVDISARLPALVRTGIRRNIWKEILTKYTDRVLFGTDLIYDDQSVEAGIQSQTFQLPEEADITGLGPEDSFVHTSVKYVDSHIKFLTSDEIQDKAPFRRQGGTSSLHGLGLDKKSIDKILFTNASRIYNLN